MKNLRAYQEKTISDSRSILSRANRAIVQSPTGSGKTVMFVAITQMAVSKGKSVLIVLPRRELVYQTSDTLRTAGIDHAVIMAGEPMSMRPRVQVASTMTLHKRGIVNPKFRMPSADLVIMDEAHLSITAAPLAILNHYPAAKVLGFTATPARSDGRGLGEVYEDMVEGVTVSELTKLGFLAPVDYYAPTTADLSTLKAAKGDYTEKTLGGIAEQPQLVGDVVTNWIRLAEGKRTVVFGINRSHARALCDEFNLAGVKAGYIDGETEQDERAQTLNQLASGEITVLCNVFVLTYGWDCPSVEVAILARPTKSIVLYLQMVGRVLRTSEGKERAKVIDHTGTVHALGFVDEPVEWSLEGKESVQKRKEKAEATEPKKITCKSCDTVFTRSKICPKCGTELTNHAEIALATQGDLTKLDRSKKNEARKFTMAEKISWYGQIKSHGIKHSKSEGWMAHQYKSKFGVWPNKIKDAPIVQTSPEVASYIRSRQIAYAKRMNK